MYLKASQTLSGPLVSLGLKPVWPLEGNFALDFFAMVSRIIKSFDLFRGSSLFPLFQTWLLIACAAATPHSNES